jgi:hypothetical protein
LIIFERGDPVVRGGEVEVAGRRIAARAIPYGGEAGPPTYRFDPVGRTIVLRPAEGRVETGPADVELWRRAIARTAAGPVLVGPGSPAEQVRGAARAAAEGACRAGRAVYLLDPETAALPEAPSEPFVALFAGIPDEPMWRKLEAAAVRMPSGLLLAVIPGWTTQDAYLDGALERAARVGAVFIAGIAVEGDGESRRRVVAARGLAEPGSEEAFFDRVHHGDWSGEAARALDRLQEGAARRGLSVRPPRPRGEAEPPGNAAAAARLEELADGDPANEHRAALLRAAVRWLDERGRDLRPVVAEGNFRKIFPFDPEIAPEVERALVPPSP